jgi:LysR family transcriptional regulator, cyn operon transcriptional activator
LFAWAKWQISIEWIDGVYEYRGGEETKPMELRHLRYFTAVAEELNFTRAADKVHVTQSTLSHQIKQLETEIGHRLFERAGRRVVLTAAGEGLLVHLGGTLRTIDESVRAAKGATASVSGMLHVGTTPTFNASLMPACLSAFMARHPSVLVRITECLGHSVEEEIEAGNLEFGIGYMPTGRTDLSFEPLYIEEMVLVVNAQHPLAGRRHVRMAELHRQPLILNRPQATTRRMLNERLASVNAEPVIVAEVDAIQPTLQLVEQSPFGTIVSEMVAPMAKGLRAIPLEDPTPLRTPGLLWKTDSPGSSACRSFIAIVRQTIAKRRLRTPLRNKGRLNVMA